MKKQGKNAAAAAWCFFMEKLIVRPRGPLYGRVDIGGAKNAALPVLAATLLCKGPSLIDNLPAIRDVELCLSILSDMGAEVRPVGEGTYLIDTTQAGPPSVSAALSGQMRASAYFLGAGLGRFGQGRVGCVGGCDFGGRPIDQHIKAFSALGADVQVSEDEIVVQGTMRTGCTIVFDIVSVGATVNAILAAACAGGITQLRNAACEPHIVALCDFLNHCGADIRGAGTPTIHIHGVKELHGCSYTVIPDMIEAGTYLLAAAATRGAVTVGGVDPLHLETLLATLRCMGAEIDCEERRVSLFATQLHGTAVTTGPYPGFPTDLQPPMTALLATAQGPGRVEERVWHNRFRYVGELQKMGAILRQQGACVYTHGALLHGALCHVPDLRAGAALLIAACAAEGESQLLSPGYMARGYENIVGKFCALGADISAV